MQKATLIHTMIMRYKNLDVSSWHMQGQIRLFIKMFFCFPFITARDIHFHTWQVNRSVCALVFFFFFFQIPQGLSVQVISSAKLCDLVS